MTEALFRITLTTGLMIYLLLVVLGCTPVTLRQTEDISSTEGFVWPSSPQQARIRYLYSFYEPADLGIRPGMFKRFIQVFTGNEGRRMSRPYAIAVDSDIIAIVDSGLKVVHLYLTKSEEYEVIADVNGESFVSPVGISLGHDVIYLTDSVLGKIFVLNRDGEHLYTISGLQRPTGIAYHAKSRRLYVADTLENRIVVFDDNGLQLDAFGTRGGAEGEFNFPSTLTFFEDILYVNDTMNFRIQAFNLDGTPINSFGELGDGSGQFAHSKGLATDEEGHLYIADALSNYIQIFDSKGRFLLAFGGMGSNRGQFRLPAGIFILGNRIFVTDTQNRRVQVFEYLGGNS